MQEVKVGEEKIEPQNQESTKDIAKRKRAAIRAYYWQKLRKIHLELVKKHSWSVKNREKRKWYALKRLDKKRRKVRKIERRKRLRALAKKKKMMNSIRGKGIRKFLKRKLKELQILLPEKPEKGQVVPENYSQDYFDELVKKYVDGF